MSGIIRHDWLTHFLRVADTVAEKSHCVRRKVGCVIVRDKRIIATGYNGLPSGFPNCNETCWKPDRKSGTVLQDLPCEHAEKNALLQCAKYGTACESAIMVVSIMPCNECLKAIIQAGIRAVYYGKYYELDQSGEELREFLVSSAYTVSDFNMAMIMVN